MQQTNVHHSNAYANPAGHWQYHQDDDMHPAGPTVVAPAAAAGPAAFNLHRQQSPMERHSSIQLDSTTLGLPARQMSYPSPIPDFGLNLDEPPALQLHHDGLGTDPAGAAALAGTAALAGGMLGGADLLLGGLPGEGDGSLQPKGKAEVLSHYPFYHCSRCCQALCVESRTLVELLVQ